MLRLSKHERAHPLDLAVLGALKDPAVLKTYQQVAYVPYDPVVKRTEATIKDSSGKQFKVSKGMLPVIFQLANLTGDTQMYAQRYLPHMPAAGEVVIFDRSWYKRAGVEPVMGFCTKEQHQRFLRVVPAFEKLTVEDGIILLKYWLEVSPEEQTRRLEGRIDDGRKIWKLSPMDVLSYTRWDDYTKARDEMFAATDIPWAPWFVVNSEDKKKVRLNIISHLLSKVPYKKIPREKVKLPKRQIGKKYKAAYYPFKFIPEKY